VRALVSAHWTVTLNSNRPTVWPIVPHNKGAVCSDRTAPQASAEGLVAATGAATCRTTTTAGTSPDALGGPTIPTPRYSEEIGDGPLGVLAVALGALGGDIRFAEASSQLKPRFTVLTAILIYGHRQ
jgi:hypothetical protein